MNRELKVPKTYQRFRSRYPQLAEPQEELGRALSELGDLSAREVNLVKLALAVGNRRQGGVHSAVRKSLEAGVEGDALRQVALLAIPSLGFSAAMAALTWVEDILEPTAEDEG